ncbi:hypothetical protein HS088_TW11G00220 [Tripterygium wilfordii]|uniref:PWWP domain-containing protein n=1 Tax=Tripterygium wilfordii TaxID=458696 RepID=A0A7J7D1E6_TRIWF|nr:PC4 and SFRS1-interacting protein-like [Tripterygium wilfordii]KAF5740154.1 hypothetical protein HS088_TW11G00220 [Tripterygium wilfordii]
MKGKSVATSKSNEGGDEVSARHLRGEVHPGDMIWVKLDSSSWWPGQVTDENTVSGGFRPCKRSDRNVLVRLYGSYEYKYVDPVEYCSDFPVILKQNDGCFHKILQKTLDLHRSCLKSSRSRARSKFIGSTDVIIDSVEYRRLNHKNHKQVDQKHEASDCVRVSPRRQLDTVTPQKAVKTEEVEDPDCQISNQDKLKRKQKRSCSTAFEVKAEPSEENGMVKNIKLDRPGLGVKTRRQTAEEYGLQKTLEQECPSSYVEAKKNELGRVKKIKGNSKCAREEAKCQSPKRDMLHRKCKLNSPMSKEAANGKLSGQDGKPTRKIDEPEDGRRHAEQIRKHVKYEPDAMSNKEELSNRKHKNELRKKCMSDKTSAQEGKRNVVPKSLEMQKELKQNSQSIDMIIDTPKQKKGQKDQRLNSPSSGPRTYGTLPKLSTSRRLRVMQDLGLAAPTGSPFGINVDSDSTV